MMRSALGKHEVWVLVALLTTMEKDGTSSASIPTLALRARLSDTVVQDTLTHLEAHGWFTRTFARGRGTTYRWTGPGTIPASPAPRRGRRGGAQCALLPTEEVVRSAHHLDSKSAPQADAEAPPVEWCAGRSGAPDAPHGCAPRTTEVRTAHHATPITRARRPSSDPDLVQRESADANGLGRPSVAPPSVPPKTLPLPFLDAPGLSPRAELPPCTSVADLERLALNCREDVDRRGRGRGVMLDPVSMSQLVQLANTWGVPAVDAALRQSGGTDRPVAHAAAILEGKARPAARSRRPSSAPAAAPISAAWAGAERPDVEELGEGE